MKVLKRVLGLAVAFCAGAFTMTGLTLSVYANDDDGTFKDTLEKKSKVFKK